ncbi:RNA methyltransferase [Polaribacter sejongensis]|uniref:RNA methyltransferase n=1 Tax=Polaribacter sejongensis TaxID=985043 RepID=A0AAJ1VGR1_9FLAO|nr:MULTISPECIES: TfoX/Sxy family protein [Polaribacter]AUC20775.1 RNA methyltransferase [Polaribacter sejongensis]MDN3619901.1 TfoX/Sxy family protein [Polaribacter undariae]UWD31663.1 TfoX/Sxy family protein [Polaribacter undariae]
MAYSEYLADRVSQFLNEKSVSFITKKMMGGLLFMVDDKMYVAVIKEEIMARINPAIYEESLEKDGCNKMNFTGKPMKGFVFLSEEAVDLEEDLNYWLQLALDFNPLAKASKKRKSSKN